MARSHILGIIALSASIASLVGCGSSDTMDGGAGGKGTTSGTATTTGTGSTGAGGAGGATTGTGSTATSTVPVSASKAGDLVVSEVMNNPLATNDDAGEWFELHNPTPNPIDLAGLVLDDAVGTHTIGSSVIVAPGGYAMLGLNGDAATNGGVAVDYTYDTIKLVNSAGGISIRTASMVTIDAMTYDEASGLDPDGQSRSLDPKFLSAAMNDTDAHWCAATSFIGASTGDKGTPGKANDACP